MPTKPQNSPHVSKTFPAEEAYFAKWIFMRKRIGETFTETIKQLCCPLQMTNWLIRSKDQDKVLKKNGDS